MDNAQKIWDKLLSAGLTPAGAAGLLGNLYAESGLRPDNLQNGFERKLGMSDADYTAAVDCGAYEGFVGDRAGYGLAQWTYPSRKAALLACAKARGRSVGDLDVQLGYLLQELQSLFPAVLKVLRTTDSVREASDCVLLQFERPASVGKVKKFQAVKELRAEFSLEFYHKFAEKGEHTLKLLKCILTENKCYKAGAKIKPKGVMVHSTGANNPMLRRYVQPTVATPDRDKLLVALGVNPNSNDWNREGQWVKGKWVPLKACVHAFVGKLADGSVAAVQTMPWDHRGWHAGNGTSGRSANDTHISFEICEDGLTDPVYFQQAYQAAVELTAMLCREYGLDPLGDGVVICHQDGYRRGIASNHGDVYNWFPRHGKTMDDFRAEVARVMNNNTEEDEDMPKYRTLNDVPEHYRPTIRKLMEQGWLRGEEDPDPSRLEDNVINLDETYCRVMTTFDRAGKLD